MGVDRIPQPVCEVGQSNVEQICNIASFAKLVTDTPFGSLCSFGDRLGGWGLRGQEERFRLLDTTTGQTSLLLEG